MEFPNKAIAKLSHRQRVILSQSTILSTAALLAAMPLSETEKKVVAQVGADLNAVIDARVDFGGERGENPARTLKMVEYGIKLALKRHQQLREHLARTEGNEFLYDGPDFDGELCTEDDDDDSATYAEEGADLAELLA